MSHVNIGNEGWTFYSNPTRVIDIQHIRGQTRIWYTSESGERVWSTKENWLARIKMNSPKSKAEYTGGSVDYYKVEVKNPTTASEPYMAECNDIIEALGMNYAEGNAFKALWRRAAHRTLGKKKAGAKDDGLYDAEKVSFFGQRLVEQSKEMK